MENISAVTLQRIFQEERYKIEHEKWLDKSIICGIDEVGRGSLFGPVVACCAILKPFSSHPLLRDSKILTETQRQKKQHHGTGARTYAATRYKTEPGPKMCPPKNHNQVDWTQRQQEAKPRHCV